MIIILFCLAIAAAAAYQYIRSGSAPWLDREASGVITVYQWRDAEGNWRHTRSPPEDRPYETIHYWENADIIPPRKPSP